MSQFDDVTRYTTEAERARIAGIALDANDIELFMDKMRKGLVEAAAAHETAVQDNFALRVETTVRLSRPVRDESGEITDHVGRELVTGTLHGRKVYKDDAEIDAEGNDD